MKILSILLVILLLLCGCSSGAQQEQPPVDYNISYAGTGGTLPDGNAIIYNPQGGSLTIGGINTAPPETTTEARDETVPPVTEQPEIDPVLVGQWQYVDTTLEDIYILNFHAQGGVELTRYYQRPDGELSKHYSMSCRPEYEDGCITFPSDVEYGPPSLVLELTYWDDVGHVLTVVSSADSLSELTEYFHPVDDPA